MTRFIQLHVLTNYPPSNLNRDDTGRPKTALVGDAMRLRISSQSIKRSWRCSEQFEEALKGHVGTRTKRRGINVFRSLMEGGIDEKSAREWARQIANQFGKLKSDKKIDNDGDLEIEQLAHISPEEDEAIDSLLRSLVARKKKPVPEELALLRHSSRAVDIAMFGRMLANKTAFNVEAAVQVAHAFTVHKAAVEEDYFSAVDDLSPRDSSGAGHIGERGYGAGLFYLYICVDRDLLQRNLGGNADLSRRALSALLDAVTKVSPTGMQASFASRSYASYVLAEVGKQQPRSLAQAFLEPVRGQDEGMLGHAVAALTQRRDNFDSVYGACADKSYVLDVEKPTGSLAGLKDFLEV